MRASRRRRAISWLMAVSTRVLRALKQAVFGLDHVAVAQLAGLEAAALRSRSGGARPRGFPRERNLAPDGGEALGLLEDLHAGLIAREHGVALRGGEQDAGALDGVAPVATVGVDLQARSPPRWSPRGRRPGRRRSPARSARLRRTAPDRASGCRGRCAGGARRPRRNRARCADRAAVERRRLAFVDGGGEGDELRGDRGSSSPVSGGSPSCSRMRFSAES